MPYPTKQWKAKELPSKEHCNFKKIQRGYHWGATSRKIRTVNCNICGGVRFWNSTYNCTTFSKSTYKVAVKRGTKAQHFNSHKCFLNTKQDLTFSIVHSWKGVDFKYHGTAGATLSRCNKNLISLDRPILLSVWHGGLSAPVCFGVVENIAIDVLLGTTFIDR